MTSQDIAGKYQIKSEIDHILSRPGTWVGSITNELITAPIYFPSQNKLKIVDNIPFNQALHKLVDEVFSNSVDEYRRSKQAQKDSLFDITTIKVHIEKNGYVEIYDNGGIPVEKHPQIGEYVPYMIFGMLRTSSNYDDSKDREVVGTNGLGAKIANVFSKEFTVETCDGKNLFKCTWKDNMHDYEISPIKKTKDHYTKISFMIDLERFEQESIPLGSIRLFQKRCIDTAASNPGLVVEFVSDVSDGVLNSKWKFDSFKEYLALYLDDLSEERYTEYNKGRDSIFILYGTGLPDMGFVNGALCSEGSHIRHVQKQIVNKMMEICKKNEMDLITEKDILIRFSVFVNCTIINPQYDSQAKTRLTSKIENGRLTFDAKFLESLKTSPLFYLIKDYYDIKYKEEKKKELRKLNKTIKETKIKKLIAPGITDPSKNELFIFEGNSASGGFRKCRNVYQMAYLLRGKIRNTMNLKGEQILENQELRELLAVLKLTFGDPQANLKNVSVDKIVFCTDMDYDGHHICGLLIAFFTKHFPELFKAGKIYRALSPIIIAKKGKESQYFYKMSDYEAKEPYLKNWDITYTKGLGGLADNDYYQLLNNKKLLNFRLDDKMDLNAINVWFDKSTELRKEILIGENTDED